MELALGILGGLCALSMIGNVALVWVCATRMNRPTLNTNAVTTGQLNKTATAEAPKVAFWQNTGGRRPEAAK